MDPVDALPEKFRLLHKFGRKRNYSVANILHAGGISSSDKRARSELDRIITFVMRNQIQKDVTKRRFTGYQVMVLALLTNKHKHTQ